MNADMLKDALDMVSRQNVISVFGLTDEEGFPFVSAVVAIKNLDMNEFWISTSPDSRKAGIIGAGCKAGLCYYDEENNVTLMGTAQIVNDAKRKKEMWLDWMKNFYKSPGRRRLLPYQIYNAKGKALHGRAGAGFFLSKK